ncbi:Uma2 family endonuclease [Streptomyces sp. NPDC021224]|uniref:Uma2 family endonuclease n=1 Tax=unclassified Streptomyces TaxID=2593676 RepID=UPI0037953039
MSVAVDHTGPWTVADVLVLQEDRTTRYELLGESLIISPTPGVRHQRASFRLHVALETAARAVGAPVEILEGVNVVLPSGLVVPDLVVADAGATADDPVAVDVEAVRLVIELVSPGNSTMDRKVKPLLYAEAAIPYFWRLEFDPAPMLAVYELTSGRYVERTTALAGATTRLDEPFPLAIDPAGLTRQ